MAVQVPRLDWPFSLLALGLQTGHVLFSRSAPLDVHFPNAGEQGKREKECALHTMHRTTCRWKEEMERPALRTQMLSQQVHSQHISVLKPPRGIAA